MNDIPDGPESESSRWPLRVWPGAVIVALVAVAMIVPAHAAPRSLLHFYSLFLGPVLGSVAAVVWWAYAARTTGRDRWLFPALFLLPGVVLGATIFRQKAMVVPIYVLPLELLLWVGWLLASFALTRAPRRSGLILVMAAGWVTVAQLRLDGTDVELVPELRWWWQKSAEEMADADRESRPKGTADGSVDVNPGDWPAFRGPNRDGILTGVKIDTDWAANPPKLVWKHRIGPGWGSFAVVGNRLFTQEQRGTDEVVVCLAADTGLEVWAHKQPARFEEAIAGAGPRATPTVHGERVYAQGATGKLVCLDAATGKERWTADLVADAGGVVPQWGYAGSPLVVGGTVVAYAGGPNGKGTVGYHADNGTLAWASGKAADGYASAHRATVGGGTQVLMVSGYGVEAFKPVTGELLWEHQWQTKGVSRVTQPLVIGESDVIIGTGVGPEQGIRRLRVSKSGDGWDVKPLWTSRAMKPYFNDGVAHNGHLYGFDDSRLCCVDLETGRERWKEGRYGHGQVLLLADQGVLVVQAVDGKVALVEASPEFNELGRFAAIEKKTWNHPVVARGRLYVRNGQWAACYRLK